MTAAPAPAASATAITGTRQYLLAGIMANSRGSTRPPAADAASCTGSTTGSAVGDASCSGAPGAPLRSTRLGRLRELLRRGQPRTGVARQQPDVPVRCAVRRPPLK